MARAKRPAQIVAVTLDVHCPYCDEPQPAPVEGYVGWSPLQLRDEARRQSLRSCVSCDAEFFLATTATAQIRRG